MKENKILIFDAILLVTAMHWVAQLIQNLKFKI
jgi:hypothetical protein